VTRRGPWLGLLLTGLLLGPTTARAQPSAPTDAVELRLLPEYTPCTVTGVRYACFTADQVAMLNALEVLAHGTQRQLRLSEDLRLELDRLVINLQVQLDDYRRIDTVLTEQVAALTAQLEHEIDQKNQYRAQAESTDYWPYVVGGIVGVLGVGFGVGALIAR